MKFATLHSFFFISFFFFFFHAEAPGYLPSKITLNAPIKIQLQCYKIHVCNVSTVNICEIHLT